jgi:predicted DNA-binding transcriptional regulator AlpA
MQSETLLDRREVCRYFGGSRPLNPSTLYRAIRKGLVPKPVKVGGSSRWLREECQSALEALIARRAY